MHATSLDGVDVIFIALSSLTIVGLITAAGAVIAMIRDKWMGEE